MPVAPPLVGAVAPMPAPLLRGLRPNGAQAPFHDLLHFYGIPDTRTVANGGRYDIAGNPAAQPAVVAQEYAVVPPMQECRMNMAAHHHTIVGGNFQLAPNAFGPFEHIAAKVARAMADYTEAGWKTGADAAYYQHTNGSGSSPFYAGGIFASSKQAFDENVVGLACVVYGTLCEIHHFDQHALHVDSVRASLLRRVTNNCRSINGIRVLLIANPANLRLRVLYEQAQRFLDYCLFYFPFEDSRDHGTRTITRENVERCNLHSFITNKLAHLRSKGIHSENYPNHQRAVTLHRTTYLAQTLLFDTLHPENILRETRIFQGNRFVSQREKRLIKHQEAQPGHRVWNTAVVPTDG